MNLRSILTNVKPKTANLSLHVQTFNQVLRRLTKNIWNQIMVSLTGCCVNSSATEGTVPYRRLKRATSELTNYVESGGSGSASPFQPCSALQRSQSLTEKALESEEVPEETIALKVTILGDCETGKTSFMAKYVSAEEKDEYVQTMGVVSMEKVFRIQNARIALRIWDLGGHWRCSNLLPTVCQDAAAILFMFDLTRRSSLHSVKEWFLQARQWNKSAIPVIIGTKYDHFVQLPHDIQLAIIRQARFYAQVMGASLFFSSVTHNINVHKIFKVIVAKLFDLPCSISKNVKFGEPIIDY